MNPRVSVLAVDPANKKRWIEVQRDTELVEEGALEYLNWLANAYSDKDFKLMPELKGKDVRVIMKVTPERHMLEKGRVTRYRLRRLAPCSPSSRLRPSPA